MADSLSASLRPEYTPAGYSRIETQGRLGRYTFKTIPLQEGKVAWAVGGYLASLIPVVLGLMIGITLIRLGSIGCIAGGSGAIALGASATAYLIHKVKELVKQDKMAQESRNREIRAARESGNPLLIVTQLDGPEDILPPGGIVLPDKEVDHYLQQDIRTVETISKNN